MAVSSSASSAVHTACWGADSHVPKHRHVPRRNAQQVINPHLLDALLDDAHVRDDGVNERLAPSHERLR